MTSDLRYMRVALSLAQRQLGRTWPNPAVGAVIVRNGQIIGEGTTAAGGRPHAETQAIRQADDTRGATLYVSLEPCSHHGQTPPCTDAIIKAGITRCVIACRDPNPQVNGKGIAHLKAAGIEVTENISKKEAEGINRGFFSVIEKKRPYVALKIATSLDGKITHPCSRWLTGERARAYGHLLRSRFDAIATGIGTVLADDPMLNCRLPGLEKHSPVRVVFDRRGHLPEACKFMKTADQIPVWTLAHKSIDEALTMLAEKGITRLLVEAGAKLSQAFLANGLVDRIYWFRAPMVIGDAGLVAFNKGMDPHWTHVDHKFFSPDSLDIFECSPAS